MDDIKSRLFDDLCSGLSEIEARFFVNVPQPPDDEDENDQTGDVSGQIAALNDRFRQSYPTQNDSIKGEWLFDEDITKLGSRVEANIGRKIAQLGDDAGFDGCPLRDRGSFVHSNYRVIWLIKTYTDDSLQTEATAPADPESNFRMMLVSLADETL